METVARWSKFSTKWQGFMWLFFHDQFSKPRSKMAWTNANSCKVGNQNSGEISSTVWGAVDERKGLEDFMVDKNYLFPQTGEFFSRDFWLNPINRNPNLGTSHRILGSSETPRLDETMMGLAFWRGPPKCHVLWNVLNLLWLRDEKPRTFADEIQFLDEMLLAIPYSRLTYEVDKVNLLKTQVALRWLEDSKPWHDIPWNTDWFMTGSLYWLIITTPIQLCSIIPCKKQPTKGPLNTCSNEVLHDLTTENSTALLFSHR